MDEMAKEIENALKHEFPKLKSPQPNGGEGKPAEPTLSAQIDALIAGLEGRIRVLEKLRATL
jgi:hypothetical protein